MANLIPTVTPWVALSGYGKAVINDAEGDAGWPSLGLSWDVLEPHTDYTVTVDIESHTAGNLTIYAGNNRANLQAFTQAGVSTLSFNSGSATILNLVPSRFANMTLNRVELEPA